MIKKKNYRSPIITVVGHIDHGKTTFLNYINNNKKMVKEHGGITQHIKSYYINTKFGNMTFLDTPGHFAFNSNRENCIKIADIVLLIISITDGIKPQTIESINLIKKFKKPTIIALNKIDKSNDAGEQEKIILNNLIAEKLVPEKWGGDVIVSLISSKTGKGVDNLMEMLYIQSEMLELEINTNDKTYGIILENKIDTGKGFISTIILKNGCLEKGGMIKINNVVRKVKNIYDTNNSIISMARESVPVNIIGLDKDVIIGETFEIIINYKKTKKINVIQTNSITKTIDIYDPETVFQNINNDITKINVIIKVDTQGSMNAIKTSLEKLSTKKIKINIIKIDIGDFNTSDIDLGVITHAFLIGFNVKKDSKIKNIIKKQLIEINIFHVIYDILNFVTIKINENEKLIEENNVIGTAIVKKIFNNETYIIAGCLITTGVIKNNSKIKITRQNNIIHEGYINSIKILKKNVSLITHGHECGITIKNFNKIKIHDKITVY